MQKEEAYNKMSASNLAIVFWPTLMRPPLMDLADKSKQLGWQLSMARMIEHPDFIPEILWIFSPFPLVYEILSTPDLLLIGMFYFIIIMY